MELYQSLGNCLSVKAEHAVEKNGKYYNILNSDIITETMEKAFGPPNYNNGQFES